MLGERTELIYGEILEISPPGPDHAVVTDKINRRLVLAFGDRFFVRVANPLDLGENQPQPDFAVIEGDLEDYRDRHPATAALVVEVSISSLSFDRDVKSRIYGDAGIPEYWIVDVEARRVEIRTEPRPGIGYSSIRLLSPGDKLRPIADASVELRVEDLL